MFDKLFQLVSYDLGIDLGTSNTLIYIANKGIAVREPTVVVRNRKTKEIVAYGTEAKKMVGRTPAQLEVVKVLREGIVYDFSASTALLKHYIGILHQSSGLRVKIPKPRVVIAIPTGVTEVERKAFGDTACDAGARKVYLIEEPMAAAIGAEIPIFDAAGALIVNMGGGSVEIAVISLGGIVINKNVKVSGEILDEAIVNYVRLKYSLLIGLPTAEELKIQIGSVIMEKDKEEKRAVIRGRDLATGLPKSIRIGESEIREAVSPYFLQIIGGINDIIEETPPELLGDITQRGIYLSGGLAQISGLVDLVHEATKIKTVLVKDPLTSVVRGCGKVLEDEQLLKQVISAGGIKIVN